MPFYQTILFDVDDTLLDFTAGESNALDTLIAQKHLQSLPNFKTNYIKINARYWRALEQQKITRDQLITERFEKVMALYHQKVDGESYQRVYSQSLHQQHQQVIGAKDLLQDLQAAHYHLDVITNGIPKVQYQRLTASHLLPFFDQVFVSEEIGTPKPDRHFFDYVANHLQSFNARTSLVIGDSLTSDIQGANNADLDSVWFNPRNLPNNTSATPTYTVRSLTEIPGLLRKLQA